MLKKIELCLIIVFIFTCCAVRAESESIGYLYGGSVENYVNFVNQSDGSVTTVIPDFFSISESGEPVLNFTREEIIEFISAMHTKGIKVTPRISNDWDKSKGEEAIDSVDTTAAQVVKTISDINADGLHIDIENLDETYREKYTELVRKIRDLLEPSGKLLTMAVASNPMDWKIGWHASYDYKALAELVDYAVILTFDEHYYGSPDEGPIASKKFFEDSIEYAVNQGLPKNKIVVGMPFFGRYWTESENGTAISACDVEYLISNYNAQVKYDKTKESCNVKITIPDNGTGIKIWGGRILQPGEYSIWYDNSAAVRFKLDTVRNYGLRGVCCWALGQENKDIWSFYTDTLNNTANTYSSSETELDFYKNGIAEAVRGFDVKNILSNYSGREHYDKDKITLPQLAAILLSISGESEDSEISNLSGEQQEESYLSFLENKNIIHSASEYDGKNITRAQFCTIIERVLNLPNTINFHLADFYDLPKEHWAYSSISKLYYFGIVSGCEGNVFNPDEYTTVSEVSDILTRVSALDGYSINLRRLEKNNSDDTKDSDYDVPVISPR